jgi:hypothetical protein
MTHCTAGARVVQEEVWTPSPYFGVARIRADPGAWRRSALENVPVRAHEVPGLLFRKEAAE